MSTKPVAAYLRISQANEESVSIAGQEQIVRAECARRGWPEPVLFIDEGVSGSKKVARPARDDLERRVAAGEFSAIVVKSVDRLARSVLDFHRIAQTARDAGAALIIVETGLDTSTPTGAMMLGILATFAEFEAATISQRVKTSNDVRIREGRALGGPVPYGLKNVRRPDGPGVIRAVDEEEAAVVRRMVDEILAGRSPRAVAMRLTDDAIPTPRGVPGGLWDRNSVIRILRNPALAGMTRVRGGVVRDEATGLRRISEAAVLDLETWQRVQEALDARKGSPRRATHEQRPLLDRIAVCGSCGGPMRRASTRGYLSYTCGNHGRGACRRPASISAPRLDEYVIDVVLGEIGRWTRVESVPVASDSAQGALAVVRAEIAECAQEFASARPEDLGALAGRMAALREHEARLLREADESAPLYILKDTGETYEAAWERSGVTERREILAGVLRRVTVNRAPRGRAVPPAERVTIEFQAIPGYERVTAPQPTTMLPASAALLEAQRIVGAEEDRIGRE